MDQSKHQVSILKVSAKSAPASVAGAVAGLIKDGHTVELQTVGAGAVNQAVKAIAIARGFLAPVGIELYAAPYFCEIEIDGNMRTSIRFSLKALPLADSERTQ